METEYATERRWSSNPQKNSSFTRLNINLDSEDDGQNWDTVMFLVTTLEMILTGIKKRTT